MLRHSSLTLSIFKLLYTADAIEGDSLFLPQRSTVLAIFQAFSPPICQDCLAAHGNYFCITGSVQEESEARVRHRPIVPLLQTAPGQFLQHEHVLGKTTYYSTVLSSYESDRVPEGLLRPGHKHEGLRRRGSA
ncbi:hypothetical protein CCMA1212_000608 [Trichoderma ghanense]|uniref:Uncharacterized protein n=1 Tax=Trichoderma ghanense TaxID=65468 RepID=A0ABY2HGC6_9HYPO